MTRCAASCCARCSRTWYCRLRARRLERIKLTSVDSANRPLDDADVANCGTISASCSGLAARPRQNDDGKIRPTSCARMHSSSSAESCDERLFGDDDGAAAVAQRRADAATFGSTTQASRRRRSSFRSRAPSARGRRARRARATRRSRANGSRPASRSYPSASWSCRHRSARRSECRGTLRAARR